MNKISVVIITLNEEKNIRRCLESVSGIADEIVIVDSASIDNTIDIAKEYSAKIVIQPFLGYGKQKNFAIKQASHNWILSLDADEALSITLRNSIEKVKENAPYNSYSFSRLTNYCGKWIKHCGWYPDKKIRLFKKNAGAWKEDKIHEKWELHNTADEVGALKGDLLHYSFYTISDHLKQIEKFTEIAAKESVEKGKKASLFKIWAGPKWTFFTQYVIRLGFLDGYYGYLVCKYSAYATLVKYTKIRQYAKML